MGVWLGGNTLGMYYSGGFGWVETHWERTIVGGLVGWKHIGNVL